MFNAIEFKQESITMFITKMKVGELISISKVMHYDAKSGKDYQRPPLPAHYRKIASYFMKEDNPILPSAVLAAIGPAQYDYNEGQLSIADKIRIVDGQHRIEGLKCLKNGYCKGSEKRFQELNDSFEIPVIIMVIDDEHSMVEIDAFINLNSKGKKVKTDLAEALKVQRYQHNIEKVEELPIDDELQKKMANDIVRLINQKLDGHWYGAIIQADENGNRNCQPISIIAYMRAIMPIVVKYLKSKGTIIKKSDIEICEDEIVNIVINAWNCVIQKWPACFDEKGNYLSDYNICKGIGVITLFAVFSETDFITDRENIEFKTILQNTPVEASHWLVGGKFTGYASAQGFVQIKQYIKGEIVI